MTAAQLPVGWVRVGRGRRKPGSVTSELYTSPSQPAVLMQKCHTHAHTHSLTRRQDSCCASLSHPETVPSPPCQALYHVNTWEISGIFWRRWGCYETLGRVTETDKYFFSPEAEKQGGGVWYLFVMHAVNRMEPLQTA